MTTTAFKAEARSQITTARFLRLHRNGKDAGGRTSATYLHRAAQARLAAIHDKDA